MSRFNMRAGAIANALGYQIVWLLSIAAAARGNGVVGPLAAMVFVLIVLRFGGKTRPDLVLIVIALILGMLADSLWIWLGWLHYLAAWPSRNLAPLWILGVWAAFAVTLNHSLALLKKRLALAALLGAGGGPLAYWAASRGLGAVSVTASTPLVLTGLGIAWAIFIPSLLRAADACDSLRVSREVLQ